MARLFLDFLDRVWESRDAAELQAAMSAAASALDFGDFAYLVPPGCPRQATRLISTYRTAWTAHYLQSGYERIDPVILQAQAGPRAFAWGGEGGDLRDFSPSQRQFFDEAAGFGIRQGFTIPLHDCGGRIAAMTFATDMRHAPFMRCIAAQGQMLQCMAACFHARARRLMAPGRSVAGIALSHREYECLSWAARGKSAWETGCILGISRRTVVYHLENVRAKLDVRTTAQAVALFAVAQMHPR